MENPFNKCAQIKELRCGDRKFQVGQRTLIMGIVNVTPDSFSDGGCYLKPKEAIDHSLRLLEEGADILDIGAYASSPGACGTVSYEEECLRLFPVIEGLVQRSIRQISVDTKNAQVAKEALAMGASWINDQSGLTHDPSMLQIVSQKAQAVVIMHQRGLLSGVQAGEQVSYEDVVQDICHFFKAQRDQLLKAGFSPEQIILDPGIGFGKGLNDSLKIISSMNRFVQLGCTTLCGVSRKSFIGKLLGIEDPKARDDASLGVAAFLALNGTHILRVHSVKRTKQALQALEALKA